MQRFVCGVLLAALCCPSSSLAAQVVAPSTKAVPAAPAKAAAKAPVLKAQPPAASKPAATKDDAPKEAPKVPPEQRWESAIQKIEANLAKQPPRDDRWVFTGSSSVTLWKLDKSFPKHNVLNHGFGGSQMSDVLKYFPRIITAAKPQIVVLYSGDNDLGAKKSPQTITDDTRKIVEMLKRDLPQARLVLIGVKPSIKRWPLRDKQLETNALLAKMIAEQQSPLYQFIDLGPVLLDESGMPRKENYKEDNLHMSEQGYALWVEKLLPMLTKQ